MFVLRSVIVFLSSTRALTLVLSSFVLSRQLRLEYPGAIWHITSRGNERREIFRDDNDRHEFIQFLTQVIGERRWLLHAWVLMSNHYHLLIETPEIGLSRGMKSLNREYAEYFNWRHDRIGHLFHGRFKGILVEREGHLLELVRYIVLNPVRAGMVRYAGDYAWSNYRTTAGMEPPPKWLEVDWTLDQFDPHDRVHACEEYRRFVADGRGASYNPWEKLVGQIYLGGEDFCERMQAMVNAKERSVQHPRPQRSFVHPGLDAVAGAVARTFGVTVDDLQKKSRGDARKALVQLAIEEGGLTVRGIAEWIKASEVATSKLKTRSLEQYASDQDYRCLINAVRRELSLIV